MFFLLYVTIFKFLDLFSIKVVFFTLILKDYIYRERERERKREYLTLCLLYIALIFFSGSSLSINIVYGVFMQNFKTLSGFSLLIFSLVSFFRKFYFLTSLEIFAYNIH